MNFLCPISPEYTLKHFHTFTSRTNQVLIESMDKHSNGKCFVPAQTFCHRKRLRLKPIEVAYWVAPFNAIALFLFSENFFVHAVRFWAIYLVQINCMRRLYEQVPSKHTQSLWMRIHLCIYVDWSSPLFKCDDMNVLKTNSTSCMLASLSRDIIALCQPHTERTQHGKAYFCNLKTMRMDFGSGFGFKADLSRPVLEFYCGQFGHCMKRYMI